MNTLRKEELIEYIKENFSYDQDAGIVTRLVNRASGKAGPASTKKDNRGYLLVKCKGQRMLQHRLAWILMTGHWPDGEIDHINGVRNDNRWINLRCVSKKENRMNKEIYKNNKSGAIGVNWHKVTGKWVASIKADGKCIHLGVFNELSDAVSARKRAEKNMVITIIMED